MHTHLSSHGFQFKRDTPSVWSYGIGGSASGCNIIWGLYSASSSPIGSSTTLFSWNPFLGLRGKQVHPKTGSLQLTCRWVELLGVFGLPATCVSHATSCFEFLSLQGARIWNKTKILLFFPWPSEITGGQVSSYMIKMLISHIIMSKFVSQLQP